MVKLFNAMGVKGSFNMLNIINPLAMLFGFMTLNSSVIPNEGGGTVHEQELAEKALLGKITSGVQAQMDTYKAEFTALVTKASDGTLTQKALTDGLSDLEKRINDGLTSNIAIKQLTEDLAKESGRIQKLNAELANLVDQGGKKEALVQKGFGTLLKEGLVQKGMTEELVVDGINNVKSIAIKGYDKRTGNIAVVKAAIDMTTALSVRPGLSPGTAIGSITDYKMKDVMIDLTTDTHMVNVIPTDPVNDKYMGVLVEYDYVDGTGTKTEGEAAGKSSLKFKTVEFKVFTISTIFHVSKENLQDIDRLESKLNRIAPSRILSNLDGKILSDQGDNTSEMKGMYAAGNFTAFSAVTFQDTMPAANVVDLIRKMRLQAFNAEQDVNVVYLHPTRIDEIEGLKDMDSNYLQSRGIVYDANGNLVRVHGLAVIRNKKQTVDKVTVMWNEAAEIGIRQDIEYEVGLDSDDLSTGMRTIVFDMRVAFGVGKPASIIVSSDPDGDIEIINKVDAIG